MIPAFSSYPISFADKLTSELNRDNPLLFVQTVINKINTNLANNAQEIKAPSINSTTSTLAQAFNVSADKLKSAVTPDAISISIESKEEKTPEKTVSVEEKAEEKNEEKYQTSLKK